MAIMIGSARHDEHGRLRGGKQGDQTGQEVSIQSYYNHKLGWIALRPKSVDLANKLANAMILACGNNHIGYNQNERLQIINYGIRTNTNVNADCSSLVRACLMYCGVSTANFTTANEKSILMATGKFDVVTVTGSGSVRNGDILITKKQGHTAIVVSGSPRTIAKTVVNTVKDKVNSCLKVGSRGEAVRVLQTNLNSLGYNCGTADGIFGGGTQRAVIAFQRAYGLTQDGKVGINTQAKINQALVAKTHTTTHTKVATGNTCLAELQKAINTDRIASLVVDGLWGSNSANAVSRCLVKKGKRGQVVAWVQKYVGTTYDGIAGKNTDSAIRNFQRTHGLSVDGCAGANTIKAILRANGVNC